MMLAFLENKRSSSCLRWSPRTRVLAVSLALTLTGAGCATTSSPTTLENQTKHVAHVRVESSPPGGTVILGDQTMGTTPTTINLPYAVSHHSVVEKRGRWRGGIVGLVLGTIFVAGSMPFYLGSQFDDDIADLEPRNDNSLLSVAITMSVIGLIGAGLGIWAMATSRGDENRLVPHSFEIGLRTPAAPGLHTVHIETTDRMKRLSLLETLHFNAKTRRWWAPGDPAGIALTMRTEPDPKRPRPAPASAPAQAATKPAQVTTKPQEPQEPGLAAPTKAP
ncbi:MAG: PEGA domain-containing protein [Deltaproteobacteria bacterium]|nr:PEGA domain-containing protein [Deltaproteobacteria bacterium]